MRLSALLLALLLSGAGAMALSSCGGGSDAKLLPGSTASQIESNLDQVKTLVESGDCVGAEDAVASVSAEVEELNVAAKLKGALQEGTEKLSEVVGRCDEESEEEAEQAAEADVEAEEEELEAKELEAEEEKAAKAEEKAEKQGQKEEEKAEAPEVDEGEGTLPPQAEGKAKGHEEEVVPPPAETGPEESESGGVSPGVGVE